MGLKKKIKLTVRVTDDGKVVDSFTTKALLDSTLTKRAGEDVEVREDTNQENIKGNYTTIEDVIVVGTHVNDLSLKSRMEVVASGCQIKAKVIGFQANSTGTITAGSEAAASGAEEYLHKILTGE